MHGSPHQYRLAYLNTRYPFATHTFIQREIDALRALGIDIHPFSIRRPARQQLGDRTDCSEIDRTTYILHRPLRFVAKFVRAVMASPWGFLRCLCMSQAISPGGLGMRLRHIAYAAEALVLGLGLKQRGLRGVHVHMGNNGALVALLATSYNPALFYSLTIHGSAEFRDVTLLRIREKVGRARFVRFISEGGRAQTMALTQPETWARFHVVHCGVDVGEFKVRKPPLRDALKILAVGRLDMNKGYDILLRALRALSPSETPWRLRVVGDGPERARLEALSAQLKLSEQVTWLGACSPEQVIDELGDAGVLVLSSFMEGIPVVLMEAMARGVPVVATCVGGVPELVEDGVTGNLAAPGAEEPITRLLEDVWRDPVAAETRAVAARVKVESEFDVRDSALRMRALFQKYHPDWVG